MNRQNIKRKPTSLKFAAWNANSLGNKLREFREFLPRLQVDVALVSETNHKPSHRANVPNYKCYRNDRLTGRGGGTAVYIKNNIDHHELPLPPDLEIEITAIMVNSAQGPLAIISAYNPPHNTLKNNDISQIFSLTRNVILAGDLNAKNTEWHSIATNKNGRRLKKYADDHDFLVDAPDSPTRIPQNNNHRPDVLDVVAYKNVVINPEIQAVHELSSDHLPILFSWGLGVDDDLLLAVIHRTFRREFTDHLSDFSIPIEISNLEEKVMFLEEHVLEAIRLTTTSHRVPEKLESAPPDVLEKIRARRRAIKTYQRTMSPVHKTELNRLNFQVRNALDQMFNDK